LLEESLGQPIFASFVCFKPYVDQNNVWSQKSYGDQTTFDCQIFAMIEKWLEFGHWINGGN
jgi:hypothetical protein